jgi:hypothetical protein
LARAASAATIAAFADPVFAAPVAETLELDEPLLEQAARLAAKAAIDATAMRRRTERLGTALDLCMIDLPFNGTTVGYVLSCVASRL